MSQRKWLVAIGAVVFCLVTTCVYADFAWNYKGIYYDDGIAGNDGVANDTDIEGQVGYPLKVIGPNDYCPSLTGSLQAEIISGTLPPGLSFDDNWNITGVPTERGHWIVKIKVTQMKCDNKYYVGYTQELRFHITGTGKVIE